MNTALHSFADIFETTFSDGQNSVRLHKIIIPIIQRDYAQGRRDPEIGRVRARFLDALHSAVTGEPITLDFVYGDIDENGVMTPLDGQQRLTTLFLLHWYAARKASEFDPSSEQWADGIRIYSTADRKSLFTYLLEQGAAYNGLCWDHDDNVWIRLGDDELICLRRSDDGWVRDDTCVRPDYIALEYNWDGTIKR